MTSHFTVGDALGAAQMRSSDDAVTVTTDDTVMRAVANSMLHRVPRVMGSS